MTSEPALALARIIVGEQMRRTAVLANTQPVAQFQPHVWVARNIADVPYFHAVLCHDPELPANASVAYWSAAWLSDLSCNRSFPGAHTPAAL
jgi:hypothetical protein